MSKKLIAVAAASALALSALIAAPAYAAPAVAVVDADGGAGTSSSPYTIKVPHENTVDSTNAITFNITGLAVDDVVKVVATGVKVVEGSSDIANSSFYNVTSLSKTLLEKVITSGTTYDFRAHTTSTATGTVLLTINRTGLNTSNTYSIKGTVGTPYQIKATGVVPETLASGKTATVTFTIADAFGNLIENSSATSSIVRSNMGAVTWDSSAKVYKSTMTAPTSGAFIASLDLDASDLSVDGFADSSQELIAVVNSAGSASLVSQVASLTAQLAASRPIADSVTQKKYNTLARKWNAAFPSQKVALKK